MIDASIDQDFAAFERQESFQGTKTVSETEARADAAGDKVYHGKLVMLSGRGAQLEELAVEVVPTAPEPAPADPLGHLQVARLAFAVAVVLVLYLIWIRRKRA